MSFQVLEERQLLSATTAVSVSASAATIASSQTVNLTGTVTAYGTAAPSQGSVTFMAGEVVLGTTSVSGGIAVLNNVALPLGEDVITASYSGATGYLASTSTLGPNSPVSLIAGNGTSGTAGNNGPATAAELRQPWAVSMDAAGDVFIVDQVAELVHEVHAGTGLITIAAGSGASGDGGDGGAATNAGLQLPQGIAADAAGDFYIATPDGSVIRYVSAATGSISTPAGTGQPGNSANNIPATSAELFYPQDVALDSAGNVYIAEALSDRIREVNVTTGIITTVAGNGTEGYTGDNGPATAAEISGPSRLTLDAAGDIYFIDDNSVVREVHHSTGLITTVAGNGQIGSTGDGGAATAAELLGPAGIAVDSAGDVFISDPIGTIREVNASTGIINTVMGGQNNFNNGLTGPAILDDFGIPQGMTMNSNGDLFVADSYDYRVVEVLSGSTTVNVTGAALHTPTVTNATTAINTQTTSGLVITPNAADAGVVADFQIMNISGGTLFLNNGITPVTNGQFVTLAQGAAGLRFTPTTGSTATGSFTVQSSASASAAGVSGGTATATITIGKASPTLSLTAVGGAYSGSAFPATDTVAGTGSQSAPAASLEGVTPSLSYYSGTSATGATLSGVPTTAGIYTVLASFAGSADYTAAAASATYIIQKAAPSLSVTDHGGVYADQAFAATDTVAGVGSQSTPAASLESAIPSLTYYAGAVATGTVLSGAPTTVGTYTVLASFAGSTDYTIGTASASFSISRAAATVSVTDNSGPYNSAAFAATETVAGVGGQATLAVNLEGVTPSLTYYSGTSITGSTLSGPPSLAGTYAVLASFAGSVDYTSATADTTFAIGVTNNPPSSLVTASLLQTSLTSLPLSWSGTSGSGLPIQSYDISYTVDNGGPLISWLSVTTLTSSTFTDATLGHTYRFFSQATDTGGHVELAHTTADVTITTTTLPWQNPNNSLDVLGTGTIVPQDVLAVIDYLNTHPAGLVLPPTLPVGSGYLDVLGKGTVEPDDALAIINYVTQ